MNEPLTPRGRRARRGRRALLAVGACAALAAGAATTYAGADGAAEHKVTLCHATGSYSNPYVEITVDYHSVTQGGHGRHEGPVFDPTLPKHTKWGDVIPPFDFGPGAQFDGLNWDDAGQAVLADHCGPSEPATTTTTESTTTTTTTPPV